MIITEVIEADVAFALGCVNEVTTVMFFVFDSDWSGERDIFEDSDGPVIGSDCFIFGDSML